MEKEIKGGKIMWFNILKDGDKLWNERTLSLFIQRLEKIFDSVHTNKDYEAIAFRKKYKDEEGNFWAIQPFMVTTLKVKRIELSLKYYVDGKHFDSVTGQAFYYNNLSELLDNLEELDKRLAAYFSNMVGKQLHRIDKVWKDIVKDIMGKDYVV